MMFRLNENAFMNQKAESWHFYSYSSDKTLPKVITPSSAEEIYLFPLGSIFFFFFENLFFPSRASLQ